MCLAQTFAADFNGEARSVKACGDSKQSFFERLAVQECDARVGRIETKIFRLFELEAFEEESGACGFVPDGIGQPGHAVLPDGFPPRFVDPCRGV